MTSSVQMNFRDQTLTFETGHIAKQADSAVVARLGDVVVLATVCSAKASADQDFFPLQVHYFEKYYAAGKIPGGFIKREGRPRDREVLVARMIDRPMRPLFPHGFKDEVQVLVTTLSADQTNAADILAMNAASAAVFTSDLPWSGPLGAVRVCRVDGQLIVNPTLDETKNQSLDLIVSGTENAISMIEGSAHEVSEETMVDAITQAHEVIKTICKTQQDLAAATGRTIREFESPSLDESILEAASKSHGEKLKTALFIEGKLKRDAAVKEIKKELVEGLVEEKGDDFKGSANQVFSTIEEEIVRTLVLKEGKRIDGRKMDELRDVSVELGFLPRTHGSAIFTRGETQALGIVTLGTEIDEQRFDDIEGTGSSRFMLHYNFPPFSVGETGRIGAVGRREVGHGKLAERSLEMFVPSKDGFPYTLRIVSEILESNGSSSMATVCASSLAMMDAGVPIPRHVAGIAMGLMMDEKSGEYAVLTDIQGQEDHLGDMDFKVAGTRNGITGFQLDVKIEGITRDIMIQALKQAKAAREQILDVMEATIKEPRPELSVHAPRIITFSIDPERIKDVIGPGGKMIREITSKSGAGVEIQDDGSVTIHSREESAAMKAYEMIQALTADVEIGKVYSGVVRRIVDFGAFIEIMPGKEGLCHVTQLKGNRRENIRVSDVLNMNDELEVRVLDIDRMGRISLTPVKPERD